MLPAKADGTFVTGNTGGRAYEVKPGGHESRREHRSGARPRSRRHAC